MLPVLIPYRRHGRAVASAAALLALLLCALSMRPALAAARFSAEPLLLKLPADKLATSLELGNQGAEAVTVQAELVRWDQAEGQDRYAPVEDVIVSPPIFELAAGATQILRVGRLKRGEAPAREVAYRLRVAEIVAESRLRQGTIATAMQLSFPVFVAPAVKESAAQIDIRPRSAVAPDLQLDVNNAGAVHGKLVNLAVVQDGKVLAERPLNWYVLAGAQRSLAWPRALAQAHSGAAELRVQLGTRKTITLPLQVETAQAASSPD